MNMICLVLAWVLMLNPLLVSASASLSSGLHDSVSALHVNENAKSMSDKTEGLQNAESCHQQRVSLQDAVLISNDGVTVSKGDPLETVSYTDTSTTGSSDCCMDRCQCADSVCHQLSMLFQHKSASFVNISQSYIFDQPFYLSLIFRPTSPPPIH
jgi:hypothetical protein